MFNWFKSKVSTVDKERCAFIDPVAKSKSTCEQSAAIKALEDKLNASENALAKLSAEVEQGYIKDRLERAKGTQLEYIEKLGVSSVKYYDFEWEQRQWRPSWFKRTMTHQWTAEYCIELRDFLLRNFPVETKETLTGNDATEFIKDGADND